MLPPRSSIPPIPRRQPKKLTEFFHDFLSSLRNKLYFTVIVAIGFLNWTSLLVFVKLLLLIHVGEFNPADPDVPAWLFLVNLMKSVSLCGTHLCDQFRQISGR
jgi:hypothetical protein